MRGKDRPRENTIMEEPAETTYPIHDLIRRRWSPRAFSDRMVEPEKLHNDKPSRHALHDVGMAIENLVIQAMALGLWVHQMAGCDAPKARQLFAIPEGYEPAAAIAIGYEGDPQNLPDPFWIITASTVCEGAENNREEVFDHAYRQQLTKPIGPGRADGPGRGGAVRPRVCREPDVAENRYRHADPFRV